MFEPALAPDTHIGVRENGDVKKPSHTGTRKHARFTPLMKVQYFLSWCMAYHRLYIRLIYKLIYLHLGSDLSLRVYSYTMHTFTLSGILLFLNSCLLYSFTRILL